jgi:hypothetical protein
MQFRQQFSKRVFLFLLLVSSFCALPNFSKAFTINTIHANLTDCDTMTKGIFIVWWDKDYNYATQANAMLDSMLAYRQDCLGNLGMQDPLSAQDGFYCNIYIHTPNVTNDFFTTNFPAWGNGVGGDTNGYPFMTLPSFIIGDFRNLAHETFHIFQTHGMWDLTTGIYNTNDGGWFIEASASWYIARRYPNANNAFIDAEVLNRIPQVPMWMGWINFPTYYPNNWQRQGHQYAMSAFLYYLTSQAGINDSAMLAVIYSGTTITPQEYLFNQIGGAAFRNHFINCAARITNNFDFILPAQYATAKAEWNIYASPLDDNQFVKTFNNTGSNGWFKPVDSITTTAWSFNKYKLRNSIDQTYKFAINGDAVGDYGGKAYFQGKVLVKNSVTGASFHDVVMSNDYQGELLLHLTPTDTAAYFVIASMPAIFTDSNATFQLFPYQMNISAVPTTIQNATLATKPKTEVARYNAHGQIITKNTSGLQIVLYNDGSVEKIWNGQ